MDKPLLAFCSPHYGPVETEVYHNHLALMTKASRTFDVKMIGVTDKMYLHTASNELVRGALEGGIDYVFWTENDMLPPVDALEKLYANRKDICGGLYFLRGDGDDSYQPCVYVRSDDYVEDLSYGFIPWSIVPENTVEKVDAIGMGCVLIKVDVFRKLKAMFPKDPWFDIGENMCGQDMYFYKKCWDAKIGVYVDTSVQCEQLDKRTRTSIDGYRRWLTSPGAKARGFIPWTKTEKPWGARQKV